MIVKILVCVEEDSPYEPIVIIDPDEVILNYLRVSGYGFTLMRSFVGAKPDSNSILLRGDTLEPVESFLETVGYKRVVRTLRSEDFYDELRLV